MESHFLAPIIYQAKGWAMMVSGDLKAASSCRTSNIDAQQNIFKDAMLE